MSDFIPKPGTIKIGGLSRAAQKLQAAKEKAEGKAGNKQHAGATANAFKGKGASGPTKKTSFQRKAV